MARDTTCARARERTHLSECVHSHHGFLLLCLRVVDDVQINKLLELNVVGLRALDHVREQSRHVFAHRHGGDDLLHGIFLALKRFLVVEVLLPFAQLSYNRNKYSTIFFAPVAFFSPSLFLTHNNKCEQVQTNSENANANANTRKEKASEEEEKSFVNKPFKREALLAAALALIFLSNGRVRVRERANETDDAETIAQTTLFLVSRSLPSQMGIECCFLWSVERVGAVTYRSFIRGAPDVAECLSMTSERWLGVVLCWDG